MNKATIKYSPWLERIPGGWDWREPRAYRSWFCCNGLSDYWHIDRFEFIQIAGSDVKPRHASIAARPHPLSGCYSTPDGRTVRYSAYREWLESFKAPVVYVWIEGDNWEEQE